MHWKRFLLDSLWPLLIVALAGSCLHGGIVLASEASSESTDGRSSAADEPELQLDPGLIRDAIASVLRGSDGVGQAGAANADDGYGEAAQEYLEHVQQVLAAASSPIELYTREQLADIDTLSQLLTELHKRGNLSKKSALRLASRLLKGPAKELILPTLTTQNDEGAAFSYLNSQSESLLTQASRELTKFLSEVSSAGSKDSNSFTDQLKSYVEKLETDGPIREYLDGVLDRTLELEGRKVRFNVEFPDAKAASDGEEETDEPSLGEPRITRLADGDDHDAEEQDNSTTSSTKTSSSTLKSSRPDEDNSKNLFDQVLCRRAAESIAAALAKDRQSDTDNGDESSVNSEAAMKRIQQLRQRKYQPAGLEAMLEAIEESLKQNPTA